MTIKELRRHLKKNQVRQIVHKRAIAKYFEVAEAKSLADITQVEKLHTGGWAARVSKETRIVFDWVNNHAENIIITDHFRHNNRVKNA